jgi:glutamate formiminotransferase / formiminotetrahydrofolate cyclodeaminase
LMFLVDEDTRAFNRIMDAFGMPKSGEEEKKARKEAIQQATRYAIEIPFQVMEKSFKTMDIIAEMVERGNPNSVTDAGVGALCARAAVIGAFLNVKVNSSGLDDKAFVADVLSRGQEIHDAAIAKEQQILKMVEEKIK